MMFGPKVFLKGPGASATRAQAGTVVQRVCDSSDEGNGGDLQMGALAFPVPDSFLDAWGAQVSQWADNNPAVADWMSGNHPEGFSAYQFRRSSHRRIRTINGLENLNKQIRRRTRVIGIVPNVAWAMRLITAVLAEIHDDWLIGRPQLNLARSKEGEE